MLQWFLQKIREAIIYNRLNIISSNRVGLKSYISNNVAMIIVAQDSLRALTLYIQDEGDESE